MNSRLRHTLSLLLATLGTCFLVSTANAMSFGDVIRGMGAGQDGFDEGRKRAMEHEMRQLELERMRREDERQRLEHEERMRQLRSNQPQQIDLYAAERELKPKLPLNIGGNAYLVNALAMSTQLFTFTYQLRDLSANSVVKSDFNQRVGAELIRNVCSDPYWGNAVRQGKILEYRYHDRDGQFISSLAVRGGVCR